MRNYNIIQKVSFYGVIEHRKYHNVADKFLQNYCTPLDQSKLVKLVIAYIYDAKSRQYLGYYTTAKGFVWN